MSFKTARGTGGLYYSPVAFVPVARCIGDGGRAICFSLHRTVMDVLYCGDNWLKSHPWGA